MAILDMMGRPIEKGDIVVLMGGKQRPFNVADVKEPPKLLPPEQIPYGEISLICACKLPLADPQRGKDLLLSDVVIVMKGVEQEPKNPVVS